MVRRLVCSVVKSGLFGAAVLGASVVLPCATCSADALRPTAPAQERTRDQFWVVSCRGAAFSTSDDDSTRLHYLAYRPTGVGSPGVSGVWQTATSDDFAAATDRQAMTCVLVLGNGYTASETQAVGQKAYRRLVAGLPRDTAVRFVLWSWPSDHVDTGPIKDLRIKAGRTGQVARSLAHWLDDFGPTDRLSLVGTSFGARIVMEALELRALAPPGDASAAVSRPAANVVLVSAAVDNDWLLPGRKLDM